jgi:hypothetical protein
MQKFIYYLLLALPFYGSAQQPLPPAKYLLTEIKYGSDRVLPDSIWQRYSVREKIDYCRYVAESYRQICSFMPPEQPVNTQKNIYAFNGQLLHFGEYVYSDRQLKFLQAHTDTITEYLKEDLLLNKSNLLNWHYLLQHVTPGSNLLNTLLDYWQMQNERSSETLTLLGQIMSRAHFSKYVKSPRYKALNAMDYYGENRKIPYSQKNKAAYWKIIDDFSDSLRMANGVFRPSGAYNNILNNITRKDTLYNKTGRLSNARLAALSAKELLAYCIFTPEKYFQLCSNAGIAPRNHRKFFYTDFQTGSIDQLSYSERQLQALQAKQDSCRLLLLDLVQKDDYNKGLLIVTNTWQAIPRLITMYRMYGFKDGNYMTLLINLLYKNKYQKNINHVFEGDSPELGTGVRTNIAKTAANEKVLLGFAMDLYNQKMKGL